MGKNMNDESVVNYDDEIDLKDLLLGLWKRKIFIILTTFVFAISSVYYALSLSNIYSSKALLAPAEAEDSLTSKLGRVSSLASLAGVSLPTQAGSKATEAIERIKSYDFFVNYFLPNINFEDLVASNGWNKKDNIILYNEKIYDKKNDKWLRKADYPLTSKPSNQEAYAVYRENLSISEDKKTSFVTISINHHSPYISKDWVNLIINKINDHMREIDKLVAENSISYLKETLESTKLSDIKKAISLLLQEQIQVLMLAESNKNYVFKPIASPIAPEKKSAPSRALICIVGTVLGFMLSVLSSLVLHFYNKK
jgi:LPS O-antigen subunit length determinant protein (WzzB/FepE family)